jgi:hypothetical protein
METFHFDTTNFTFKQKIWGMLALRCHESHLYVGDGVTMEKETEGERQRRWQ